MLALAVLALLGAAPCGARAAASDVQAQVQILERNSHDSFAQDKRERAIRALGRIGGKEAAAALLPIFDDPFVHLHDRAVSAWIAMLKGAHAADTRAWIAGHALRSRDPAVRRGAAIALGVTSGTEVQEPLARAIAHERDGPALAAMARAAARLRGPPDLGGALLPKLRERDGAAVLQVALAAAKLDGPAAVEPLRATLHHRAGLARAGALLALQRLDALPAAAVDAALADKDPAPAMALAESLELRTKLLPWPAKGLPLLERLLAHPSWRVRAAAVQGALRVWDNAIVEPLVARLGQEHGRIGDDVRRALETYTGKALGSDPDLWRAWWRQKGADFDPGPRPALDPAGNVRFRAGGAEKPVSGTHTVAFFDLPLSSKRLAFVFDLSGSMKNAARKGSDAGPTKIDLLRSEFEKTLSALPEDTTFDLFVYRYWSGFPPKTKLTRALGRMLPCTKANARKALAWLARQEPKGWGAFYEPLQALLQEDVDSVVLLSDGRPSRGLYDRDTRILDELPRADRFRRMAVNTVLIGTKGADRTFMRDLAAATGGRFREVPGR
jgi:HEAT repeat protein